MYGQYNSRNTGRYNTPGNFVSAGELHPVPQQQPQIPPKLPPLPEKMPQPEQKPQQPPIVKDEEQDFKNDDDMNSNLDTESNVNSDDGNPRPPWMKSKLTGVKNISNKERRRRQNQNLRRILSLKNALMVLNEMVSTDQLSNFKVEPVSTASQFNRANSFVADLNLEGQIYKGFGDNKVMARNAAAEQAIRDLIIKKMTRALGARAAPAPSAPGSGEDGEDEESLPMIQLASFALYKLFCEWEVEGHKVPQLRPLGGASVAEDGQPAGLPPKKLKTLPEDAALLHPCMLLTYMRPSLEYRELAAHGDKPQTMLYTVGVEVDGNLYIGKAQNKKEARKIAAKVACKDLFGVDFINPTNEMLK